LNNSSDNNYSSLKSIMLSPSASAPISVKFVIEQVFP